MRLCLDSFVPPLDQITHGTALWISDLGFRVIGVDLVAQITVDESDCHAVRELLEHEGVSIGQVWSVGSPLIRPDTADMAWNLDVLIQRIPLAATLGCRVLLVEAGGYHPVNPWFPHARNHTDEALEALSVQLRLAAPYAAEHGVVLAPEMSLMTILSSVERAQSMLDTVGHEGVGINYDPANILAPESLYRSGAVIRDAFDKLGDRIVNVHAKDVVARDVPLVVHLDEAPAGTGVLDYAALLGGLRGLPSWTCLVIEHLTDYGQVAEVKAFLERTAKQVGVEWS